MKPTESVMTDEEFVRSQCRSINADRCFPGLWMYIGLLGHSIKVRTEGDEPSAWAEAAEFTRQHIEKIRLVEEEIEFLDALDEGDEVVARLLAREQSVLDDLKRGLK